MSAYKSDFLNVLAERGFIHQVSEPETLDARAKAGAITAYIGFDCTAASLHVGSLLPIMMLYWLQQTGHRPIALMGGGTTRVGDPPASGRYFPNSSNSKAPAAMPSWRTMLIG
jgi:tyrosyl-tRNA synthetase